MLSGLHFGGTNVTRNVEMKNLHGYGSTVIQRDIDASSNTLRAHIVTSKIVILAHALAHALRHRSRDYDD